MNAASTSKIYEGEALALRVTRELPRWSVADGALTRTFTTYSWKGTLMIVNTIGHLAEAAWHHPNLAVSYSSVVVRLSSHDAGGITDKDFALAAKIEDVIAWQPAREGNGLEGTPNADPAYAYIKYDA